MSKQIKYDFVNKAGNDASKSIDKIMTKYVSESEKQLIKNMELASIAVEGQAKRNIKTIKSTENKLVDTARMLNSITHEVLKIKNEIIGIIGTNVTYAKFHELGTSNIPARPFLRPALIQKRALIKKLIINGIKNTAKKVK